MTPLEGLRLAMADVDAFYKKRGIFQAKFGFGKKPALVVIDMACGWTLPQYAGGSERLDTAIEAIQKLLPVAREKKIPIFFTTSTNTVGFRTSPTFGLNPGPPARYYDGFLYELVICSSLQSVSQRAAYQAYVNGWFGL